VVCHFPPGTSKWNQIEHRLFSYISQNWRGKPLRSFQTIVSLIAATTTAGGLKVNADLNQEIMLLVLKSLMKNWHKSESSVTSSTAIGITKSNPETALPDNIGADLH
jgi:hypothetical protein